MTKVTRTIKLKFLDLNQVKQQMFADMQVENTRLANELLAIPYMERREMTTAKVRTTLKSAKRESNNSAYHFCNWSKSQAVQNSAS